MARNKRRALEALPAVATAQQVADYLQLSRDKIYGLAKSGDLVGMRVTRTGWRFTREEVEAYLRRQQAVR